MRPIPVLLCIDVEPDAFFVDHDRPGPWLGYEAAVRWLGAERSRLPGDMGPARFTWVLRMDHQIAEAYGRPDHVAAQYRRELESTMAAGDDIGLHAHAYRWDPALRRWIVDHGDQAWVDGCLRLSFDAFADALGRPCTTYRGGDRWLSHATVQWLDRAGVRYDLTLEPGHGAVAAYHPQELFTGSLPDYSGVPKRPFRPSTEDYREADLHRQHGILMVPMTTARVPARWLRRLYYRLRQPWRTGVWTAMLSHDPVLFRRIIEAALGDPATTHLALPVRCEVFASPRLLRRVSRNLDYLSRHPRATQFVWTTSAGVMELHTLPREEPARPVSVR